MQQFVYRARDKEGKTVTGVVESLSPVLAARTLQEHGLLVVSVNEKHSFSLAKFNPKMGHVSEQEVATFIRLLSTMMKAGLPLVDALGNLAAQTKNALFIDIIRSILHDVQGGGSLSASMARFPKVFNNLEINLVKAGEASGKVEETTERLADMLEGNLEFKAKIKGAMIYPVIVVMAMMAVGLFMITTIIPKIADVYKEFGADLPLPTKLLIGLSDFIRNYTLVVVAIIALIVFLYRLFRRNPASEYMLNNAYLNLPIVGALQTEVIFSILARTLGTLVNSGVSILESLKIVSQTIDNNKYRQGIMDASRAVEKGLQLSDSLKRNPDFPVMMSQLMAVGEETGTLGESLLRVAKFYQDSAERKIKGLTTAIEPLMIILMGIMVGGLAVAVLLPMFNLVNVIK